MAPAVASAAAANWRLPPKAGLYDPANERDACGVGFVVNIDGVPSHRMLVEARSLTLRMEHRGAKSADNDSGDGAGAMVAMPHTFYSALLSKVGIDLPELGGYATGIIFLDTDEASRLHCEHEFEAAAEDLGLKVIFWRDVPRRSSVLGEVARNSEPVMRQVFLVSSSSSSSLGRCPGVDHIDHDDGEDDPELSDDDALMIDRSAFVLRKWMTSRLANEEQRRFYVCSLSTRTVVYKGQLNPCQLWTYFDDLADPRFETHICIVHTRFSTNTFPSWERAHPNRFLAHNGEINTLKGNCNLMRAREGVMKSEEFGKHLSKLYPVVEEGMTDSGSLDNVLEFLVMAGKRSLPEAIMTMVPEAWQNDDLMDEAKKAFYRWASCSMEPWDGPALLTFSDGRYVGAILDRNGLRPSRFYVTKDRVMIMASEVGVVDVEPGDVVQKDRLRPGRMLLVDTLVRKAIIGDDELKQAIAASRPHGDWWEQNHLTLQDLRDANTAEVDVSRKPVFWPGEGGPSNLGDEAVEAGAEAADTEENIMERIWRGDRRMPVFGYTMETVQMLMIPMLKNRKEALGSMGNDAPLACLSGMCPLVYDYFKQLFAQVTNPPIDPFREKVVMSLKCPVGPEANLLEPSAAQCQRLWLDNPVLSLEDLEMIKHTSVRGWKSAVIDATVPLSEALDLRDNIGRICRLAEEAASRDNCQFIILSDRTVDSRRVPVSMALACGAVHHHLIRTRLRSRCAIVLETGEAREVHQLCVLIGFGCDAICPYMVFEIAQWLMAERVVVGVSEDEVYANYTAAVDTGISKVMAKMGISTMQSYKGAQIFEAVGLADEVMDTCFAGAASRVGGVTFDLLAREAVQRHQMAFGDHCDSRILHNPGFYHFRTGGEKHVNEPRSISLLQEAAKDNSAEAYSRYREACMDTIRDCTLRGQLELVLAGASSSSTVAVDVSEVEPASEIVKRFVTGAMSFGSISIEAHTTLAYAMNRLGGKSNTGEGGENEDRYLDQVDSSSSKRSAIKQVASGRFGVTSSYLAHADELQIKMAQGAKPGEGGELPGSKVSEDIARTRHSVPGVGLISPPPHHDIYSIEDLAQLIYDLKAANPAARISVKLVSENGVGVVASGVAKGKAEHILISGHDGGTGASSWTGIKGAGLPWELGLAETHQTLTLNDLRSRVVLQVDGQLRTGFDVVVGALLGADEFGFSTAPLIALGCIMMRKCHLNTCPVGIATQDPVLRQKFRGQPEHVVNFLFLLAEEVREHMAGMGVSRFADLIGRTDLLRVRRRKVEDKPSLLAFDAILTNALSLRPGTNVRGGSVRQDFELDQRVIDAQIWERCASLINNGNMSAKSAKVTLDLPIRNSQRAVGATLSYHISLKYGEAGLPGNEDDVVRVNFRGSAGQSFGAFLARGVTFCLEGDANDYVGKGLSGGKVVVKPPPGSGFRSEDNVIVGNVCLYGATSGTAYFRGLAAERFCVRNSGATAVVEGIGDHGCEYMTGGRAVILGSTGRNFGAGMSGGIAFVYDPADTFRQRCNTASLELFPVEPAGGDDRFLRTTLVDFVEWTGSEVGARILKDFEGARDKFVKVYPTEYRLVMEKRAAEKASKASAANGEAGTEGDRKLPSSSDEDDTVQEVNKGVEPMESGAAPAAIVADIEDVAGKIKYDKVRGFMKYQREKVLYRSAKSRLHDWDEIFDFKRVRKGLKMQAARCMDCGVPFCHSSSHGCPLGNIIPKFNDMVHLDHWRDALDVLLQTNNFPEFTGRVCPAPCEGACVLGIIEPAVTIKSIECAIVDKGFQQGWIVASPPPVRTGKRVAVVGSGPAGLAAADQLNKAGHWVTVYERNNRVGGLLTYGIPTMKLSKEVVQRRVDLLADEGVAFVTGVAVGQGHDDGAGVERISVSEILGSNDAVLMCTGATWPRDLADVPGRREASGIYFAMEFLQTWQQRQRGDPVAGISAEGLDVVVIGGGDTGCDCIGTALRQGARSITTFEILPQPPDQRAPDNPWPQFPRTFKVDYGHEEVAVKWGSDPRRFNTSSKEFLRDGQGRVSGIRTCLVDWTKDGTDGRWKCREVEDSEKIYPCQMVLLAMGFLGPERTVLDQASLETDPRGNIKTPPGRYSTSVPKVFAAGDCRRGQSLVVWAISEGRQAAREVDEFLMGKSKLPTVGGIIPPEFSN